MKPIELSNLLTFAIKNNFPILIKGKPGIGKSDIVAGAAKEAKAKLIISHPVVSDPTDYKGLPFLGKDGIAHFTPFGELNELLTAEEPTVFFLDDLGQAPASVQAACMQLILARRINGHIVSDTVTFIAATNRKEDKAGVSGLLEPIKSRFASIVELEVNVEDWVKWALENNMPVDLISFIRFRPAMLEKFDATKDITNSPSPRTVANVGRLQNAGIDRSIEFEVFKGAAGEGFAAEYMGFLKFARNIPNIDQIILNPKQAEITKEPAVQYALAGALASRVNPQNQEAIITYMNRLPKEIGVVCMKDMATRDKNLCMQKPYIKWATENANVII
jgi:hypothetical protein